MKTMIELSAEEVKEVVQMYLKNKLGSEKVGSASIKIGKVGFMDGFNKRETISLIGISCEVEI